MKKVLASGPFLLCDNARSFIWAAQSGQRTRCFLLGGGIVDGTTRYILRRSMFSVSVPSRATRRNSLMGFGSVSASSNTTRPTGMDQRHPSHRRRTAESTAGGKGWCSGDLQPTGMETYGPGRRGRRPNLPLYITRVD